MKKEKVTIFSDKKTWRKIFFTVLAMIFTISTYQLVKILLAENKSENMQSEYSLSGQISFENNEQENNFLWNIRNLKKTGKSIPKNYQEYYQGMKQKNDDFLGWLAFDSGLIDLPFVQTDNNETYLNQGFTKKASIHGTVFLDYQQNLNNKNLTLYGHYVYNNRHLMFSPLEKLIKKEEYEKNKYLKLFLENEIRHYEIVAIVEYKTTDYPIYTIGDLSSSEFETYKEYIAEHKIYDTGTSIRQGDRLLTLQTCVRNDNDARWLVVAREID